MGQAKSKVLFLFLYYQMGTLRCQMGKLFIIQREYIYFILFFFAPMGAKGYECLFTSSTCKLFRVILLVAPMRTKSRREWVKWSIHTQRPQITVKGQKGIVNMHDFIEGLCSLLICTMIVLPMPTIALEVCYLTVPYNYLLLCLLRLVVCLPCY